MIRKNVPKAVKEPCPFCGGKAIREVDLDEEESNRAYKLYHCSITCTQCTANITLDFVAPSYLKWPDRAASRFISAAWNRRIYEKET